jgi:uncharacterized protein YbjQ (UPF0145 family)
VPAAPDPEWRRERVAGAGAAATPVPFAGSACPQTTSKEPVMLISTTSVLEGKRVRQYLGLVSGDAILGANIFKDFFAGIRDIVGGRAAAYENELRRAKEIAMREMQDQAAALGANAVIGVDIDYESVGQSGGMLMVSVSGTAVVCE